MIVDIKEAFEHWIKTSGAVTETDFRSYRAGAKHGLSVFAARLATQRPQTAQEVGDILSAMIRELE